MDTSVRVLENEFWKVGMLPGVGMSTAFGRIRLTGAGSEWLDLLRPTPAEAYSDSGQCSSYVLIPYSNRLKDGKFRFRGKEYAVSPSPAFGIAIHGFARDLPWRVEHAAATQLVAGFDWRSDGRPEWPFAFSSRIEIELDGRTLRTTTRLRNESKQPFPAGFGHHPYFQRVLEGADDGAQVEIPCSRYYLADKCIPSAAAVAIDPRLDFRKSRSLDRPDLIDDCLTGRERGKPVRIRYPRSRVNVEMTADEVFSHVVFYVPPGKTFFAVEPVTNANDGFNLFERGIEGTGVFVLQPGEEKSGTFALDVSAS
jgi:aldose 1-epimerase